MYGRILPNVKKIIIITFFRKRHPDGQQTLEKMLASLSIGEIKVKPTMR